MHARETRVACIAVRNKARALGKLPPDLDVPVVTPYRAALADPAVDAVYVTLPNALHKGWIIKALEAGKHVLCEKPMALKAADVADVARVAARCRRYVMEAYMYRFHPQWERVAAVIAEGRIGTVRTVVAQYAYVDDDYDGTRFSRRLGGGVSRMVGCYAMNIAYVAFGARPLAVTASARWLGARNVDTTMSAVIEFPAGHAVITATVEAFDSQYVRIIGSTGMIEIPLPVNPMRTDNVDLVLWDKAGGSTIEVGAADQFQREFEVFARGVRDRGRGLIPLEESRQNARLLDAVTRSARAGGRRVVIDHDSP
jgi:predicted dehydrogenase